MNINRIPQHLDQFTVDDFNYILDTINRRRENFPEENMGLTWAFTLINIGDMFSKVLCTECEWEGVKITLESRNGEPTCPAGHKVIQSTKMHLGWVEVPV